MNLALSYECELTQPFFARPQVYHFCHKDGRQETFHCGKGTVFNEYLGTCDHSEAVYCTGGYGYAPPKHEKPHYSPPAHHGHHEQYHEPAYKPAHEDTYSYAPAQYAPEPAHYAPEPAHYAPEPTQYAPAPAQYGEPAYRGSASTGFGSSFDFPRAFGGSPF